MTAKSKKLTPLTLTGGSEPTVSLNIDWLSLTFRKGAEVKNHPKMTTSYTVARALNAYNTAIRFDDGRLQLSHTDRPEMGTHIICSGEVLRAFEISPMDALKYWVESGATITRIDLAVDVRNHGLNVRQSTVEISEGRIKTRAKECPTWQDPKNPKGYTQYVGKKSSEIYLKLYDKAGEVGVEGDWARVEITFSDKRAHEAAKQVIRDGDFRKLIVGFADFPEWEKWRNVMGADVVQIQADRATSKTKKWLIEAAASALAKELITDGDDSFYFTFLDAVKVHREKWEDKRGEFVS
jgi:hypothetical protein